MDSGLGDPLGGCSVTPEGYAHMTALLSTLAEGRIVLVMEGGAAAQSIILAACDSSRFSAC
eukprot:SAG11_NODE_507_length_8879_cov_8.961048_4_plen_61_part_00